MRFDCRVVARTPVVVLLLLAGCVALAAQERPDLTGTWVATTDAPTGIAAAPSAILGAKFALRLDGETLTVIRPVREENIPVTLKLDGSVASFRVPGRMCEGDSVFMETATWEGDGLALTGVGRILAGGGQTIRGSSKRLMRLASPDTLTVEASMTQGGTSRAVATVYKRSDTPMEPRAAAATKGASGTVAQVAWITGFWSGPNGALNNEERWTPAASGSILGLARTMRNNQLASFEFLCIYEREGSLVYTAMPDGRTTPTHFTLTSISPEAATFENPAHDFPKVIRYALKPDGTLETTISGAANQRSQSFVLKRQP